MGRELIIAEPTETWSSDKKPDIRPLKRMHFPIAAKRGRISGSSTQFIRRALAYTSSFVGPLFFRSVIDPEPIISVPVNTLTLVTGGSGTGKGAQVITPLLALVDEPILYIDPQREAGVDVPLRNALGRFVYVFDERRADSASTNVLAGLSPEQHNFKEVIGLIVDDLCPEGTADAKSEEGRKYTRQAIIIAIANEILFAKIDDRPPSLVFAIDALGSNNIVDATAYWRDHGLVDFRELAGELHFDVSTDLEIRSGISSFVRRDLAWLRSRASARLVTGETDIVADPRDMIGHRIKCDWFLQPGENLEQTASLWRVLLGAVRRERRNLTKAQADKIGTPTWFIVDEFPAIAGAGAKTFDFLATKDRQKRCLPVYFCQHEEQIAEIFGKSKLTTWQDSAALKITLAPDAKAAKPFSEDCGEVYKCETNYAGDGNGLQAHSQRQWVLTPAVPVNHLMTMKLGDVAARYTDPRKRRNTIIDRGPLFFDMPLFRSYVKRCHKLYPFAFSAYVDNDYLGEADVVEPYQADEIGLRLELLQLGYD